MTRVDWLPSMLRAEGVTVVEHPGWQARGGPLGMVQGVICHHTAGPAKGNAPSLGICVNGRSDLPGPLAQIVLARDGTAIVIAAGKANHAGAGSWRGITGNAHVLGIEAENTGRGEPWSAAQLDAYVRCCAAICRYLGLSADRVCGHKEWAPRRKIDPAGIDMASFRLRVAARLGGKPDHPTQPSPSTGGPLMALTDAEQRELLDLARAGALRTTAIQNETCDGADPSKGGISKRILASLSRIERALGQVLTKLGEG